MKTIALAAVVPLCLFASCAKDAGAEQTAAVPRRASMNERFGGGGRDPNSFQREADGKLKLENAKRSQFENVGQSPNFQKKGFNKKDFKTGSYARKSWLGGKDYETTTYAGDTDGSRFSKPSALGGQGARESGRDAGMDNTYGTSGYATSTAREAGNRGIAKPDNALIENRRNSFKQPAIINWGEQRSMTLQQSKGILGN